MRLKILILIISLSSIFFSCKDAKELEHKLETPELNTNDSNEEVEDEMSKIKKDTIIQRIQGTWKESEYPFRVVEFQDSLVKFIEEGIVEESRLQEYKISGDCPFEVNNINNIEHQDLILVMIENKTCEKLKISNNTLTLSGFNVNTGSEYQIIYKKVD